MKLPAGIVGGYSEGVRLELTDAIGAIHRVEMILME
jgi:hypothetical protein